jgi:CBS domain-containing membrane protein
MKHSDPEENGSIRDLFDISEEDIIAAMKDLAGYIDITPGDFKKLYLFTYRHALDRINHFAQAKDIMTREVITVRRQTSLQDTAELMAENGISGVPVIEDDGRVAGVISEKDFLAHMGARDSGSFMRIIALCFQHTGCCASSILHKNAETIMTTPAVTIQETTTVAEIMRLFRERKINRAPVLGPDGTLAGIVSRDDVLNIQFPGRRV